MSETPVYAAILAGGSGQRMGNTNKPKQFFLLDNKPIIIHTIEKFCITGFFKKIIVLCPETWISQTSDLIKKHCPQFEENINVVCGGKSRNDTILHAIEQIEKLEGDSNPIIVTHDAVRPFVSFRIIKENIDAVKKHGACDTVVPCTDTIVESENTDVISNIPPRRQLYQGQTPQSFFAGELKEMLTSLTAEEKMAATDACKAYVLRGKKVSLVSGDIANMKITYPQDMLLAQALMGVVGETENA